MTTQRWRVTRGLVIGAVSLVVAALLVADIVGGARGCGSIDPGDPANYSVASIRNDRPSPVIIDDCEGSYCSGDVTSVQLAPDHLLTVHAACGADGNRMTSWHVGAPSGTTLGYIAIRTPQKHDGLVFDLSRASHRRDTPTPSS